MSILQIFAYIWDFVRSVITKQVLVALLKDKLIKYALKELLGSVAKGGFKAWLIQYVVSEFYDEIGGPMVKHLWRKGNLFYDKAKGELKYKKIVKAKDGKDEATYISVIGSV